MMMKIKNGMRPVHPGEVLREDFLVPAGITANALAKALHVPAPRINDIVRERRCALMAEPAGCLRFARCGNSKRPEDRSRGYADCDLKFC
jgi:addiction module HigA family antidote